MAKEATLQVRMDEDLKEQVEQLYKGLGTSFAEAVRIFAKQSVLERAMPFVAHIPDRESGRRIGVAEGKFVVPDDIDQFNNEISDMFGVKE